MSSRMKVARQQPWEETSRDTDDEQLAMCPSPKNG